MHILLGLLGSIVTILILLNRLAEAGIYLRDFNPFLWKRRRDWRKQYNGNPVFKIDSPMDATALLMVAVAKADGDMTAEAKQGILNLFESEFKLCEKEASGLMVSSVHLLGDGNEVNDKLSGFLKPSKPNFTATQTHSALSMIERAARASDGSIQTNAQTLLTRIQQELVIEPDKRGEWSRA